MSKAAIQHKTIYYGDCLDWMTKFTDECVDLIYLDPPFNSNANYNVIFGKGRDKDAPAQMQAFTDTWRWNEKARRRVGEISNATGHPAHYAIKALFSLLGECGMMSYLSYMAERVAEMHRILKDTGTLYLHCDPTASHYLKVIMDSIFGARNFRNEVIWAYAGGGVPNQDFPRKHDVILRYSKTDEVVFNVERKEYGKHNTTGERATDHGGKRSKAYNPDGTPINDWWPDIKPLINWSKEKTGYPTQKPRDLLERIIKASTNEGDLVLDPFCGCGTTLDAARATKRKWAGIDVSSFAVDVIENRMNREGVKDMQQAGIPADLASAKRLAETTPFQFETWAVARIAGMVANRKQSQDGGVDGRGTMETQSVDSRLVIAQVKGGKYTLSQLRDFLHVVERENAGAGVFITLEKVSSRAALAEIDAMGTYKVGATTYPRVQLWSIEEHFEDRECALPPLLDPFTGKAFRELGEQMALNDTGE